MTSWNMTEVCEAGLWSRWTCVVTEYEGGSSSLLTLCPALLPHHISIEETRPLILSHWQFWAVEGVGWDFSWKLPDPDRLELNVKQLVRFQAGCSTLLQRLILVRISLGEEVGTSVCKSHCNEHRERKHWWQPLFLVLNTFGRLPMWRESLIRVAWVNWETVSEKLSVWRIQWFLCIPSMWFINITERPGQRPSSSYWLLCWVGFRWDLNFSHWLLSFPTRQCLGGCAACHLNPRSWSLESRGRIQCLWYSQSWTSYTYQVQEGCGTQLWGDNTDVIRHGAKVVHCAWYCLQYPQVCIKYT